MHASPQATDAQRSTAFLAAMRRFWWWVQNLRPWRAYAHFTNVGGNVLVAGMSYLAIFAVFAALAVGFGVLGAELASRPELMQTLVNQINALVPGLVGHNGSAGAVNIDAYVASTGLTVTSIIAAVSLVWVAMNWFTGTRRAIRLIFGLEVRQYKNAVLLKLRDFVLALLFGAALVVSAVLTVLSTNLTEALFSFLGWSDTNWLLSTVGVFIRNFTLIVFDMLVLVAIHTLLAEVKIPMRRLLVGTALGALFLWLLKLLGSYLLGGATSNPLLASFAVIIGLLIWFNLICRVLLLTSSWMATGLYPDLARPIAPGEPHPAGFTHSFVDDTRNEETPGDDKRDDDKRDGNKRFDRKSVDRKNIDEFQRFV